MRKFLLTLAGSLAAFILATGAPVYATESTPPSAGPSESASSAPVTPECAAYTYFGTETSLCADFDGRTEVDCVAIGYRVTLKSKTVDPWRLDEDGNGIGCQSYGRKPASPSTTPTRTVRPDGPTPSAEAPGAGGQGPTLPLTGPGTGALVLGGMGVVGVLAGITVYAVGRRRQRFQA